MKKYILILFLVGNCFGQPPDWVEIPEQAENHFKFYRSASGRNKWVGFPNPNYAWESNTLSWEREVIDENGKKRTVKTYKKPIEIIANFKPESKVYGVDNKGKIERATVRKFGGSLKGFIWLYKVKGGGEVTLPFTAEHIFIAKGDRLNPILTEISTDTNAENYYESFEGKTHVYVKTFSGIGGAAGAPSTLIAHYKMNEKATGDVTLPSGRIAHYKMDDDAATTVVVDETGDHNGEYQLNDVAQNTSTGATAGIIDGVLDFVGGSNGEQVNIPDHDNFSPGDGTADSGTPFSISAWVYMHDATGFVIASKGVINTDGEWRLWLHPANDKLYMNFNDEDVSTGIGVYYDTVLTDYEEKWLHIVITYDGGILYTGINIYINGANVAVVNNSSGTFVAVENLNSPVYIGRYSTTYANGLIDNVVFFNKELAPDEITLLYNACIVKDSSGNSHHGGLLAENTGSSHVAGKINGSLDFDGSADYMEIADHDDFTPAGTPFSFSIWINPHEATDLPIVSKGVEGADGEWRLYTDGSDKLFIRQFDESIDKYIGRTYSAAALPENQWLHIVFTSDGGTSCSGINLYVDGVNVDDADDESATFAAVENLTGNVWIGYDGTNYADGLIDNVMFFSVEFSADEVKRLYNNNNGTEILAEIDSVISPRRSNTSPLGARARFEFP